ncbi:MAG: hypothetical protein IM552_11555, partial [Chitinophagaceae bacterium]|nr:hypothetical protein [Chitinophagaceae bacterium]
MKSIKSTYTIRYTGVYKYYDTTGVINKPDSQSVFLIQDAANYTESIDFVDHGDSTIEDNITGLMWTKYLTPKCTLEEANLYLIQLNKG